MLALLLVSILVEGALYLVPFLWQTRHFTVIAPLILTTFSTVGLLLMIWNPLAAVLVMLSVFRIINYFRIAKGRIHEQYLWRAARRSWLVLSLLQGVILLLMFGVSFEWTLLISVLVWSQALFGVLVLASLTRNLIKTGHRPDGQHYADKELPSISVAVPARNETGDLENCLRSILASDYPKLEVLVLDDCSQDKTAEIIRSFAHDGVRFVKGYEPAERWLAKNQAYDKLADEASGELILFCGVDVRFGPGAIRALVTTMQGRKKDMVSVMPRRVSSEPLAAFIQPLRYWWELVPPRRFFNRPAVLSTCWLIRRKTLKKLGGMEAVQHAILPEGYFARELVKTDGYSFIRAHADLDIQTQKNLAAGAQTAIRMRYPQVRRRLEWVAVISLAEVLFMLAPFVVLASGFWAGFGITQLLGGIACLLLVLSHVMIVQLTNPGNVLIAVLNFPLVVVTELVLGYASMFKYEFSTVEWKGRNICIPVMHVYPKLPPLK